MCAFFLYKCRCPVLYICTYVFRATGGSRAFLGCMYVELVARLTAMYLVREVLGYYS